jgi:2-phospho-L-lactate guanylyltransferase
MAPAEYGAGMRTAAILPVKRLGQAKQRLGDTLAPGGRAELAEAMIGDVLDALAEVPELDEVIVVSGEPRARRLAADRGATLVADPSDQGQSAAAMLGVRCALEHGMKRVLLVPGDCPALDGAEVTALLRHHDRSPGLAIVPDRHGTGTNALLIAPPDAVTPAFGPGSCARHVELARTAQIEPALDRLESLALDIDTGDDLEALRRELERHSARAPLTRQALGRLLGRVA